MDKILTVNDVATILQVKAITVREMFREKRLRGFKVGKAWRTTKAMLQEDIDALARGEAPTELAAPAAREGNSPPVGSGAAGGELNAKTEKDTVDASSGNNNAPTGQPAEPSKSAKKSPAKKPASSGKGAGDGTDEDTQQLLF